MAQAATSFYNKFLNRHYLKLDKVHEATVKDSSWLKRVKYNRKGGEGVMVRFTLYGQRSTTGEFSAAQTISGNTKNSYKLNQLIPHGEIVGSIRIPHRDIALSRQETDAAGRALKLEVDRGLKQHGNDVNRFWWSNPGLAYNGTAAAFNTSTNKITFATKQECSNLAVGDELQISADDGDSASDEIVSGSAVGFVVARSIENKTVTISDTKGGTAATPTNWASTSYFYFRRGTFQPGTNDLLTPLQAFLTPSEVSTTLHQLDRSIDGILSGFRSADVSGKSVLGRIRRVVAEHAEQLGMMKESSEVSCVYINPVDWNKAQEELHAQGIRDATGKAEDGYRYITVVTPMGDLMLVAEPQVVRGQCFILAESEIVWNTPSGGVAEWIDDDGSIVSRMPNSNDMELRPVSYIAAKVGPAYKHARLSLTA